MRTPRHIIILICVTAAMLMGILYFGLRPKDFELSSQVSWLENQNGLRVGRYNTCYADNPFQASNGDYRVPNAFTIEIALKSQGTTKDGFQFITVLHDGSAARQLLIGQWRSSIVIMNGNDYDNKKRTPKMYIQEGLPTHKARFLTITTGKKGTFIYLEGQLVKADRNLLLTIPAGKSESRLVLGNSVNARHPWTGEFYGFAIYPYEMMVENIGAHFEKWMKSNSFAYFKSDSPEILYTFEEKSGHKAIDHSGKGHHLSLPAKIHIFKKEILLAPRLENMVNMSSAQDVVINFLGFIPFALALNAVFWYANRWSKRNRALVTLLVCFTISLAIELIQSQVPSRSSQLIDLILNTIGPGVGLLVFGRFPARRHTR